MTISSYRSAIPGVVWPAIIDDRGAQLLALLWQFAQTERWPADTLLHYQLRQLDNVLDHAWRTVPWYREQLAAAGGQQGAPLTPAALRARVRRA